MDFMNLKSCALHSCLLLSVFGCSHWGNSKIKSEWSALREAESLSCKDIPLKGDDLRIDRVHLVPSLGPSLILEVTTRRGLKTLYHLAFKSMGQLKEDRLVVLPISQDATFLGAGISGQNPVFVLKTLDRDQPVIQVRDLTSNALLFQYPTDSKGSWELGPWNLEKGLLRALVREAKNDEAMDDQPYQQIEVNTAAKSGGKITPETAGSVIGQASIFFDSENKSHIFWLDRGTSEKVKNDPRHQVLSWKAGPKETPLEIDDKGRIESWSFLEGYDHNLVAMIKGDSLLWENASIDISRLSKVKPFSQEAQISLPLSKVHVAQPLLAQGPKGEYLLLPQWLDHELTVALYAIVDRDARAKGFLGTFNEGTSFYSAFFHEPSQEYYLLSKAPTSGMGRYSLCSIDL